MAFLFKPLDLGSGMAVEWLCFKIWGRDETYSFRPQSQFVSMSILFLGCGQPQKDQKCWNDLILLCILFVQNLGPKQP